MINVMIAGTHQAVRHGLKEILEQESDICVSGEAASVKGVLEKFSQRTCDVLIFDFDMLRRGGVETLKQLAAQSEKVPIIVMGIQSEEPFASRILAAGAKAYLAKSSISETVVGAVRQVWEGQRHDSSLVVEKVSL